MTKTNEEKIKAWQEAILAIIRAKYDVVPADVEAKVNQITRLDCLDMLGLFAICSVSLEEVILYVDERYALTVEE